MKGFSFLMTDETSSQNDKINILFKTSEVIVINRNVVNNYNTFEKTK